MMQSLSAIVGLSVALTLVTALVALPAPPLVAGSPAPTATTATQEALKLDGGGDVSLAWAPFRDVSVSVSPRSIQAGISCGLADMCGLNPCLCGSAVDKWGACACNGLKTVEPTVSAASSDDRVVRVLKIGRVVLLVPVGTGRAVVTVRGHLVNYTDASYQFNVRVTPPALFVNGIMVLVAIAIVAGVYIGSLSLRHRFRARRTKKEGLQ
jgi:hypothetical protein